MIEIGSFCSWEVYRIYFGIIEFVGITFWALLYGVANPRNFFALLPLA